MNIRSKTIRAVIITIVSILLCLTMVFGMAACSGTPGETGPKGDQGIQGDPGENGDTPYIGDNGNWWIGNKDTGVYAGDRHTPAELENYVESLREKQTDVSGFTDMKGKYYSDYATIDEARTVSRQIAVETAAEGMVLLKNENGALPLASNERAVTMLGVCSTYELFGGGGAGSGIPDSYGIPSTSLKKGVEIGGFRVNPVVDEYYLKNYKQGDLGDSLAGAEAIKKFQNSFRNYGDAAIVTIGRTGREGSDCEIVHTGSDAYIHDDVNKHYLQLTDGEKELIKYAKSQFPKVIVLLNTGNIFECGEMNEPKTKDNLGVDAILWTGHFGNDLAAVVGPILSGDINPSGHTADTWYKDFTKDPTYKNMSNMAHITDPDVQDPNGTKTNNSHFYVEGDEKHKAQYATIEYREGIYVGYRYYETRRDDMNAQQAGSGDAWYDEPVLYPFGYGLSYTTFDWELVGAGQGAITKANETVTMKVKVTNTGNVGGRDVVEMYVTPPYEVGGIEKSSVNLMGFEKTRYLLPGESEVVTVQCVAQDFASFDWNDANNNGFVGYELEAGDYVVSAKRDAHDGGLGVTRTIAADIKCETDYTTGNKIEAVFSQPEGKWGEFYSVNDSLEANLMSRTAGLEVPASVTVEDRTYSQSVLDQVESRVETRAYEDKPTDYWYVGADGPRELGSIECSNRN